MSVWIKLYKTKTKNASYKRSQVPRVCTASTDLCDNAGLLFHKRKDGGAQWIDLYTLHKRRREMGLGALQNVS